MATLIGMSKLGLDDTLSLLETGHYSLSKGVYTKPQWSRNVSTGEVIELPAKTITDYFIHLKVDNKLNRRHINKGTAVKVVKALGTTLNSVQAVSDY